MKYFNQILIVICLFTSFLQAKDFRGAEYRTRESYIYGRFEVRMKSAQMSGMLSSFFTYHEISSLADWNEIDIEILGRYTNEVQFNVITSNQTNHVDEYETIFNPHNGFHVYAIEWTPDYVAWFVDSVEVYRQTSEHISTLYLPQKLMMNVWPPAYVDWVGYFNETELPVFAYYDWVQYYNYTPGENNNFTLEWRDDFNIWDTTRWQKASHTWDGNNCDFIYDNAVFQDSYLILCLTKPDNIGYSSTAVEDVDRDAPYLFEARYLNTKIILLFSEPIDKTTAESISSYLVPGIVVESAILDEDQRTVVLHTSGRNPDLSYNLFVMNVEDKAPDANTIQLKPTIVKNSTPLPAQINIGGTLYENYLEDQIWEFTMEYGRIGGFNLFHSNSTELASRLDEIIYQTEVRGITFFNIRVPNGIFELTLMFSETEFDQIGQRVFSVYAEENKVIDELDIYKEVGSYTAFETIVSNVQVRDNLIELYFKDIVGKSVLSGVKVNLLATNVNDKIHVPEKLGLNIYPNPFNPSTIIEYELVKNSMVNIQIYDVQGRIVTELLNARQNKGKHAMKFSPGSISSGLYFCCVVLDGVPAYQEKLIFIK